MTPDDKAEVAPAYGVRIPSLFEIFFGKLAKWIRQLALWRKLGFLRKAMQEQRRRRSMRLEALEPRVLLSADLTYGAVTDTGHHDLSLVADTTGGTFLRMMDGTHEVGSVDLSAASDAEINITSAGVGAANADTVHIDVDSLAVLQTFVDAHGGELKLNFHGGSQAAQDDQVALNLDGTPTLGFGLYVDSNSDIVVGTGNLSVGAFTLDSEEARHDR